MDYVQMINYVDGVVVRNNVCQKMKPHVNVHANVQNNGLFFLF